MYELQSNITIGKYRMKVHEVSIRKSLNSYMDKAVIKVPTSARLNNSNGVNTSELDTAKQFAEGDKVIIELGYNGKLSREFIGFVSRVNFTTPVEIECEGYAWQLRHKTIDAYYVETTLKKLLEEITKGTDIIIDNSVDDMPIKNLPLPRQPLLGVFDYLKNHCGTTIYFKDNVLFAGLKYTEKNSELKVNVSGNKVKHVLGKNVIKDGDLKLRKPSEVNVQINYTGEKEDGTKAKGSAGSKGGKVINHVTIVQDEEWLNKMAQNKLREIEFEGYEGSIQTFLIPFTQPGDTSELQDNKYAERSGNYLIESVEVAYGVNGGRRKNELGIKVS